MDQFIDNLIALVAFVTAFLALLVVPCAIYEYWHWRDRAWLRRLRGLQNARRQQEREHAK